MVYKEISRVSSGNKHCFKKIKRVAQNFLRTNLFPFDDGIIHLDRHVLPFSLPNKNSQRPILPLILHQKPSLTLGPHPTIHSFIQHRFLRACFVPATDPGIGDIQGVSVLTAETFQRKDRPIKQVSQVGCDGCSNTDRLRASSTWFHLTIKQGSLGRS